VACLQGRLGGVPGAAAARRAAAGVVEWLSAAVPPATHDALCTDVLRQAQSKPSMLQTTLVMPRLMAYRIAVRGDLVAAACLAINAAIMFAFALGGERTRRIRTPLMEVHRLTRYLALYGHFVWWLPALEVAAGSAGEAAAAAAAHDMLARSVQQQMPYSACLLALGHLLYGLPARVAIAHSIFGFSFNILMDYVMDTTYHSPPREWRVKPWHMVGADARAL
jgi:hypothetical protein